VIDRVCQDRHFWFAPFAISNPHYSPPSAFEPFTWSTKPPFATPARINRATLVLTYDKVVGPGDERPARKKAFYIMKFPSGMKPAAWGAAGGAVVWWVLLAFVFGWTSAGTADKQRRIRVNRRLFLPSAPICANKFLAQPDAAVKKAALAKADTWKRRDEFPKEWVTLPGGYSPDSTWWMPARL